MELLLEHCFDLPDLFLNFAEVVFGFAFDFQGWIVCDFACRFFDDALYLMDISLDLVLRTGFHLFSLFRQITHVRGSPRRGLLIDSFTCSSSQFQQPIKEGTIALQGNA